MLGKIGYDGRKVRRGRGQVVDEGAPLLRLEWINSEGVRQGVRRRVGKRRVPTRKSRFDCSRQTVAIERVRAEEAPHVVQVLHPAVRATERNHRLKLFSHDRLGCIRSDSWSSLVKQDGVVDQEKAGFSRIAKGDVDDHRDAGARERGERLEPNSAVLFRLTDLGDVEIGDVEIEGSSAGAAMISAKVARRLSGVAAPKPRKSRSRVARSGSSNHTITSIPPLSTKRSAWDERDNRASSLSSAYRVRTRSNASPFALAWASGRARTEAARSAAGLRIGSKRFDVGSHLRPGAERLRLLGDGGWGRLPRPQQRLQAFEGERQAN